MSGGSACQCTERQKPVGERQWVVRRLRCHYSAFAGYRCTWSEFSAVQCLACGRLWRTKAAYVDFLTHQPWLEEVAQDS